MKVNQIKETLVALHKEFGTTKFSVAITSAVLGACVGFTTVAVVMPNDPIVK